MQKRELKAAADHHSFKHSSVLTDTTSHSSDTVATLETFVTFSSHVRHNKKFPTTWHCRADEKNRFRSSTRLGSRTGFGKISPLKVHSSPTRRQPKQAFITQIPNARRRHASRPRHANGNSFPTLMNFRRSAVGVNCDLEFL